MTPRLLMSALGSLALLLLTAACTQPEPVTAPGQSSSAAPSDSSSATRVVAPAPVTPELLDKVCHTGRTDSSSTVFQAVGPEGDVKRLVVTPSRSIADMGNLIFDLNGALLGTDTGSEMPWDDRAIMEKEGRRVAALMGGSEIRKGTEPIRCQ